jgi:hypothetical protein
MRNRSEDREEDKRMRLKLTLGKYVMKLRGAQNSLEIVSNGRLLAFGFHYQS